MADKDASNNATATMEKNDATLSVNEVDEKPRGDRASSQAGSELDLVAYHEHNAGRLVVDPE